MSQAHGRVGREGGVVPGWATGQAERVVAQPALAATQFEGPAPAHRAAATGPPLNHSQASPLGLTTHIKHNTTHHTTSTTHRSINNKLCSVHSDRALSADLPASSASLDEQGLISSLRQTRRTTSFLELVPKSSQTVSTDLQESLGWMLGRLGKLG